MIAVIGWLLQDHGLSNHCCSRSTVDQYNSHMSDESPVAAAKSSDYDLGLLVSSECCSVAPVSDK